MQGRHWWAGAAPAGMAGHVAAGRQVDTCAEVPECGVWEMREMRGASSGAQIEPVTCGTCSSGCAAAGSAAPIQFFKLFPAGGGSIGTSFPALRYHARISFTHPAVSVAFLADPPAPAARHRHPPATNGSCRPAASPHSRKHLADCHNAGHPAPGSGIAAHPGGGTHILRRRKPTEAAHLPSLDHLGGAGVLL